MIINSIFTIFICTTLVTAILTIITINPVISVIFLISTFVQVAGLLLLWGINFVGISYIVIYVGAIAVLFLFVVMMIDVKLSENNLTYETSGIKKRIPLFVVITFMFTYIISMLLYPHNTYPTTNNRNLTIDYDFINSMNKKVNPTINSINSTNNNINHQFERIYLPNSNINQPIYGYTSSNTSNINTEVVNNNPIVVNLKDKESTYVIIENSFKSNSNPIKSETVDKVMLDRYNIRAKVVENENENPSFSPDNLSDAQLLPMEFNSLQNTSGIDTTIHNVEQIEVLGQDLYTNGSILLIILSIILLLAMFATIIISKFKD